MSIVFFSLSSLIFFFLPLKMPWLKSCAYNAPFTHLLLPTKGSSKSLHGAAT